MNFILKGESRSSFALALILLIVPGVLSYWSNRTLVRSEEAALRSQATIDRLDDLLAATLQTESSARGYLASGQDFYLPAYATARNRIGDSLGALRELTGDDAAARAEVERLHDPLTAKIGFNDRLIALRRDSGEHAGREVFLTGEGHALMDRVREQINRLRDRADRELHDRRAAARRNAEWSIATLAFGLLVGIGILIRVYRHLNQEIAGRRRSEHNVRQVNRLYAVLSRVSQAIGHVREREALFHEVCRIAVEEGQFRMAWMGTGDPPSGDVKPVASAGFEDGYLEHIRVASADTAQGQGPTGLALREGRHCVCLDIATDPRMRPWRVQALARGYRSSAAFPVRCGGTVTAVFTVYASEPEFFDAETVALMSEVAADIAFALESMGTEARRLEDFERRERAEQEILRLNESLEHRVAERTAELERANRMKSEFLARASHELRTPLNAIIGFSTLLGEEPAGPLAPKYRRFVANIQEGGRHLLDMVNELLDLTRIEAGRLDLNREWFQPARVLDEVLSVIMPLATIKNIAIDNRVEDLSVNADRTRFKQILYNLLSNAVKFTPENGRVWIEACGQDDSACFSVGDTGIGIPEDELAAVFEEFHRVEVAAAEGREGSGLGLAITRRLVELHGGTVRAESRLGEGSRFLFSLGPASLQLPLAAGREAAQ